MRLQQEEEDRIQALKQQRLEDDEVAYLEEVARQIEEEAKKHEQLRIQKEKERAERQKEELRHKEEMAFLQQKY